MDNGRLSTWKDILNLLLPRKNDNICKLNRICPFKKSRALKQIMFKKKICLISPLKQIRSFCLLGLLSFVF